MEKGFIMAFTWITIEKKISSTTHRYHQKYNHAKAMSWFVTSLFPDCVRTFHQLECKKNSTNHIPYLLY